MCNRQIQFAERSLVSATMCGDVQAANTCPSQQLSNNQDRVSNCYGWSECMDASATEKIIFAVTTAYFLMALSVLPGNILAMVAHLLPYKECAAIMMESSSSVNGPFLRFGFNWFSHLQQECDKVCSQVQLCGMVSW